MWSADPPKKARIPVIHISCPSPHSHLGKLQNDQPPFSAWNHGEGMTENIPSQLAKKFRLVNYGKIYQ